MSNIASRIRSLRKSKKLSQETLARAMDVQRTTVTNWERGIRVPDVAHASKLSRYFGVPIDYLYGRTQGRNTVLAPPTFTMDINLLNAKGQDELMQYYKYLLTQDRYRNEEIQTGNSE